MVARDLTCLAACFAASNCTRPGYTQIEDYAYGPPPVLRRPGSAGLPLLSLHQLVEFPDFDGLVATGRSQALAVRAQCDTEDAVGVSLPVEDLSEVVRLPDPYPSAVAGRHQVPAVRSEDDAPHTRHVPLQVAHLPARHRIH